MTGPVSKNIRNEGWDGQSNREFTSSYLRLQQVIAREFALVGSTIYLGQL